VNVRIWVSRSSRSLRHGVLLAVASMLAVSCAASSPDTKSSPRAPSGAAIGKQFDDLMEGDATGAYRNLRAVRVTVRGTPVFERYFGAKQGASLNVQSTGKTIVGTLVGIAIDEKLLRGPDQTLAELLPSYRAQMTPQVKAITLRQLLTMSAALADDDAFYSSVFDTDKDWVAATFSLGTTERPGSRFSYSSAGSHLLSAVLSEATGRSVLDYARERLFDPLGIDTLPGAEPVARTRDLAAYERAAFAWPTDPQGRHIGGGGMKLTAADLSKLGQLWLDHGAWKGRQLVSKAWLDESQAPQISTQGQGPTESYGFQQWVTTSAGHDAFAALGYGGQVVEVVPDLDLVVVIQSTSPRDPRERTEPGTASFREYLALVDTVIAPAVG
jgi:CubicO group peptidase (beta-lactamase class C family)